MVRGFFFITSMVLDIDKKEINVGDTCICTLNSRQCWKIIITGFTEKSIYYTAYQRNGAITWKSYMHKSSEPALNMYKI